MNKQKPIPERFKPQDIEVKWQKVWEEKQTYSPNMMTAKKPYYNLMMFPYPSAEGLHVGNMYAFTGVDVHGRYKRMQGFDVFEPIGLDGFGIHSENYAIKVGRTPAEHAAISQKNFYRQLRATGNGFDWRRTLETYDPDYYRWTQWLFVQMFKHGLAYRTKAEVNWCPTCKTVLADEQVIDGKCERTGDLVERKKLEQWFFRITSYAERLLQNTYKPTFNWPDKVKIGQRNWIGKKEGINIRYQISRPKADQPRAENIKYQIEVFTTAPVNFGMTFLVISPEYRLVQQILDRKIQIPIDRYKEVEKYVKQSLAKTDEERKADGREKTGVFTGLYVINPVNNQEVPVWISDFVVKGVGTGAVQGCPGHDYKDFEFAQKFGIPIKRVVVGPDGDMSPIDSPEKVIVSGMKGTMVNSEFLNGLEFSQGLQKTMDYFEEKGWGKRVTSYHLRDWLISRQRYWGAPIPMIYCQSCADKGLSWFTANVPTPPLSKRGQGGVSDLMQGWYPVPEKDLPVLLPDVKQWKPTGTGKGPLASVPEFYTTICPGCGSPAERETDVCDTFLDSSWYYLRYPSIKKMDDGRLKVGVEDRKSNIEQTNQSSIFNPQPQSSMLNHLSSNIPWDPEITKHWMPVDSYIGGAEHTVLHLLYTRFTWMALKDWGYIDVKSQISNVKSQISNDLKLEIGNWKLEIPYDPDEPFKRFYAHGLIIKDGAKMSKSKGNVVIPDEYIKLYGSDTLRTYLMFLGPFDGGGDFRDSGIAGMYRWLSRVWRLANQNQKSKIKNQKSDETLRIFHKTIKTVTQDMEQLHYNTAIARLMEFVNFWTEHPDEIDAKMVIDFIKLLAPFAPHMTEELFQLFKLKSQNSQPKADQPLAENVKSKNEFISIHRQSWPRYDETLLVEDTVTITVQINGKMRDLIVVSVEDANNQTKIEQAAKASAKAKKWLSNNPIKKTIFVSGKIINFVI